MKINKFDILTKIDNNINYFSCISQVKRNQLKVAFHYSNPQNHQDIAFASAYNQWLAAEQIKNIHHGCLQVVLIPLAEDLSLDSDNKKYLHSSQIETLNLQLNPYGFSGNISFKIPYDLEKETLWSSLLLEDKLFAIQIYYQESEYKDKQYQVNENSKWSIQAYVSVNQDNSIELKDQFKIHAYQDEVDHYLECKLLFCDALCFIAQQHFPTEVYTQQSYGQIFKAIFAQWSGLLSVKIADGLEAFISERPWLCLHCPYPKLSFYDLFFRTLAHYQYQLLYDYTKTEPNYSIALLKQDKGNDKPVQLQKEDISSIRRQSAQSYFATTQHKNYHWSDQTMAEKMPIDNSIKTSTLVKIDAVSCYPTHQQFQTAHAQLTQANKNQVARKYYYNLTFNQFIEKSHLLPSNALALAKPYGDQFSLKDATVKIETTTISFTNIAAQATYAGETSTLTQSPNSDDIQHDDYRLNHGVQISTTVYPSNNPSLTYPDYESEIATLTAYGWISDYNPDAKDSTYFLAPANSKDAANITTDSISGDRKYTPMHSLADSQLSYVVQLANQAMATEKESTKKLYITLPYSITQDHQMMPLRKNTPVLLELGQESGNICHAVWHSLEDKVFTKDKQVNKITLGANDAAEITHIADVKKPDESTFEISAIIAGDKAGLKLEQGCLSMVYTGKDEGQ